MAYMSATGTGWQSCITDRHLLVLCTCMHVCLQRLIKLQGTKVFEQQAPKVTAAVVKAVRRALKQLPQDGFVQEQVSLASNCCSTSGLFSSDQWHGRVCLHENLLHGGIQPACRQDGLSSKPHAIASRRALSGRALRTLCICAGAACNQHQQRPVQEQSTGPTVLTDAGMHISYVLHNSHDPCQHSLTHVVMPAGPAHLGASPTG